MVIITDSNISHKLLEKALGMNTIQIISDEGVQYIVNVENIAFVRGNPKDEYREVCINQTSKNEGSLTIKTKASMQDLNNMINEANKGQK